ncbi:ABC transporter substrate-binding protein [Undibacterium sp. TS12]|uniref:substrate-binding periplasmic protein n=1 Tax=Undibacterium sp. TS12 TaxID=2908202 RepID=UPI001F4C9041|nr:ABC transporter substrate-binding protein [Undibacterium sp. TS12]MCH8622402.1 ABC transporter substrate-binding protein [Undibacterium sp. TS12]
MNMKISLPALVRLLRWCGMIVVMNLSLSVLAADPTEVTVYADESYPPYSYAENGEAKGVYPAIFVKAFERMPAYKVKIKPVSWKRGLMLLETGQGLALFPPYNRPLERPYITLSEPVLTEQVVVFCTENVMKTRKRLSAWPEDFYGLKIGINAGFSVGGDKYKKAVKESKLYEDQAPGNRSNILKLLLGRIDCYANDRLSILWEIERIKADGLYAEGSQAIVETVVISQELAYLGYTNRDNGRYAYKTEFSRLLNQVLTEMKKSGEVQKIVEEVLSR